jgi:DNA-binding transcriptional LysR family regulator
MTVKAGGVTSRCKKSVNQSAFTKWTIKSFRRCSAKKLFRKIGRKNELTREGALVYGFCRQMFELSEEMHESITEDIPHASRRVYIGVSNEIAHSFVVEVS